MARTAIHEKIAHLSEGQLDEMIRRYYAGENIQSLLKEFNISSTRSQFHGLFPPTLLPGTKCPACGALLVRIRAARSHGWSTDVLSICCSECDHKQNSRCRCDFCATTRANEKQAEIQHRQAQIRKYVAPHHRTGLKRVRPADMSLREAVVLVSLVRACGYVSGKSPDEGNSLQPLAEATIPFTPKTSLTEELIEQLITAGLIAPSADSRHEAFSFEDNKIVGYYYSQVRWTLLIESAYSLISEIEKLALSGIWPDSWQEGTGELWLEIAYAECKEYFCHCAAERRLPVTDGQSLDAMLCNLLRDFSVAQCYFIIMKGATYAADYRTRKQCSARHAANYMIGACQRWADRARTEVWDVYSYRRNFDLPRSMVSFVLHDVFFKIGERGFTETLRSVSTQLESMKAEVVAGKALIEAQPK